MFCAIGVIHRDTARVVCAFEVMAPRLVYINSVRTIYEQRQQDFGCLVRYAIIIISCLERFYHMVSFMFRIHAQA